VCTRTVAIAQPDHAFQAVCDLGNESDEAQTTTAPVLGRTAPRTSRSDTIYPYSYLTAAPLVNGAVSQFDAAH
jgi:hypothetical protein